MLTSEGGFVKLFRSFQNWEWYKNSPTKDVFIHILLNACWQETTYRGKPVEIGQLVTTLKEISEKTGTSIQQTRTALNNMQLSKDLTIKTTSKNTIITLNLTDWICQSNKQITHNSTLNQHTNHTQPTNTVSLYEEEKKKKEIKKRESGEAAAPSLDEIEDYFLDRNFISDPQAFYFYYDSNNWTRHGQPISNWCSLAELWERREQERPTANIEDTNSSFEIDDLRQLGILTEEII